MLRFDVETISIATIRLIKRICQRLRFDVETISIATELLFFGSTRVAV